MTYHPSQGRVSKRYNRRVRYAYVTRRLKLRVAELETEVERLTHIRDAYMDAVEDGCCPSCGSTWRSFGEGGGRETARKERDG